MSLIKDFFKGFHKGMSDFGHGITVIINTVLLLAVYLVGVGLTSIFAKITRKHFLDKALSKQQSSYWEDLRLKKKPLDNYYRQF